MTKEYIEERNGGMYLAGMRVSLDSIVRWFSEGMSPEAIREEFPVLSLAQVYGAITYYLDHRAFKETRDLGLRISARPAAGPVNFRTSEFRSEEAKVRTILRPHETVLVDLILERRLEEAVFRIRRAA